MKQSEASIQKAILNYLSYRSDVIAWRNNTGAVKIDERYIKFGHSGMSDILGVIKGSGKLLAIEVKSQKGRLTADQKAFSQKIIDFGGIFILARCLEDVVVYFNSKK